MLVISKRLLLLAATLSLCRGQLELDTEGMQRAVDSIAWSFTAIRNEGLGIDSLEETLREATYTSQTNNASINALLLSDSLQTYVNDVLSLFDNISTVISSPPNSPSTSSVTDCCDSNAGSQPVCAYTPASSSANADVAEVLSRFSSLQGGEVRFGGVDGSIIRTPSAAPPINCSTLDSRLQQWFAREVRQNSNPLEVVILMDTYISSSFATRFPEFADKSRIVEAASLVVNSLTTADKIGVVGIDSRNISRIPTVVSQNRAEPKVIPVCTDSLPQVESFVTSFSPQEGSTDFSYPRAFQAALSMFTNSTSVDKVLLYFAIGDPSGLGLNLGGVRDAITRLGSGINIRVYVNAFVPGVYETIATDGRAGVVPLNINMLPTSVAGFYSIPTNQTPSNRISLGRANAGSGNLLTLTRPVFNGTKLYGVLYATLPFTRLLSQLSEVTRGRDFSYVFVLDENHTPLFHPSLPGDLIDEVLITDLESEGVISGVLDSNTSDPMPVMKEHLIYAGTASNYSYVHRLVPSTYQCRRVNIASTFVTICFVLADEERFVRTLNFASINIQNRYTSQLTPVYHNVKISIPENLCNYYCKQSTKSRISFQLTGPSRPTENDSQPLVETLRQYMEGTGNRPDYVQEGVAEEAAIGLAVSNAWLNENSTSSDYITRRHLATPSGLYLTYPPAHLVSEFQPTVTEWYRSPSAHPSLLTISPPRNDPLREGTNLTVSVGFALRPPSSSNDRNPGGPPLAVVSADITLTSLRVFVEKALPLCSGRENSSIQCIIIDDIGNLIYEREIGFDGSSAAFFGRQRNSWLHIVLSDLSADLITKRQCADRFVLLSDTKRFHSLNTSFDGVVVNPRDHCTEYMIQRISGTNTFLVVFREEKQCTSQSICNCGSACRNCRDFSPVFCECPCNCVGTGCQRLDSIPTCPMISFQNPNYNRVNSEAIEIHDNPEEYCFNQRCSCRTEFNSCYGVRDCYWCEAEQKCVEHTECCSLIDGPQSCCGDSVQVDRFLLFASTCLRFSTECMRSPTGIFNVTYCPTLPPTTATTIPTATPESNTSTIVAAVVGGLIGILLIVFIVLLIVYYQVCRKADPADEASKESAFDFSNKTALSATGSSDPEAVRRKNSKGVANSNGAKEKGIVEAEEEKDKTPPKENDSTL